MSYTQNGILFTQSTTEPFPLVSGEGNPIVWIQLFVYQFHFDHCIIFSFSLVPGTGLRSCWSTALNKSNSLLVLPVLFCLTVKHKQTNTSCQALGGTNTNTLSHTHMTGYFQFPSSIFTHKALVDPML